MKEWLVVGIVLAGVNSCAFTNENSAKSNPGLLANNNPGVVLHSYSTHYPPIREGNHGEEIVVISTSGDLYVNCMYEVGRGECDKPYVLYSPYPDIPESKFVKSTSDMAFSGNTRVRHTEDGTSLCNIQDARKEGLIKAECSGISVWTDLSGVRPCPSEIGKYGYHDGRGGSFGETLMSLGMSRPHCICKLNKQWIKEWYYQPGDNIGRQEYSSWLTNCNR